MRRNAKIACVELHNDGVLGHDVAGREDREECGEESDLGTLPVGLVDVEEVDADVEWDHCS